LPDRLQRMAGERQDRKVTDRISQSSLPRPALLNMLTGLRRWIEDLAPAGAGHSRWTRYAEDNSYDSAAIAAKADFTRCFTAAVQPKMLWDIGCNTGDYAEIALKSGANSVIGFDTDPDVVDTAFRRAVDKGLRFLPLVMD